MMRVTRAVLGALLCAGAASAQGPAQQGPVSLSLSAQFGACAVAKGVPNPNMGINNEQKKTKVEIMKALADSFAFCDEAFSSLSEENGAQMLARGRGQMARSAILADLIAHSNEMYGTAAVYLRAKNVVPPSTEGGQQPQQRGGGAGRGGA